MLTEIINQRYKLISELGRGAFGTVFVGLDLSLEREVAVKMLNADIREQAINIERFWDEARLTGSLSDPNILTLYDCGEDESGRLFIVTELLKGESLDTMLKKGKLLDPLTLLDLFIPLTKALQHAHDHGIIHRDIKPGNIFLTSVRDEPTLKLLDFGIAKSNQNLTMTITGHILGSPAYMSPEQALGDLEITPSADLYSLGVSLYHCLTGSLPYAADTILKMLNAVVKEAPLPLTEVTNDTDKHTFQLFFDQTFEKLPHHRFASATHMCKAMMTVRSKLLEQAELRSRNDQVEAELNRNVVPYSSSDQPTPLPSPKEGWIEEGVFPADIGQSKRPGVGLSLLLICLSLAIGSYSFLPKVRAYIDDVVIDTKLAFQSYGNQPIPKHVTLVLHPQKLTYQLGDMVELKLKVTDKFGDELDAKTITDYQISFSSAHSKIKVIGEMINIRGTGLTQVSGCLVKGQRTKVTDQVTSLDDKLCHSVEIKVLDELLPF